MMIGEFEFENIFFGPEGKDPSDVLAFPTVTIILFLGFVVIMSIIIVNLLVGLAVDDIKEVRDQAELKKAALQVLFLFSFSYFGLSIFCSLKTQN